MSVTLVKKKFVLKWMSLYISNTTLIFAFNFTLNKYSNFSLNATLSLSFSYKVRAG